MVGLSKNKLLGQKYILISLLQYPYKLCMYEFARRRMKTAFNVMLTNEQVCTVGQ